MVMATGRGTGAISQSGFVLCDLARLSKLHLGARNRGLPLVVRMAGRLGILRKSLLGGMGGGVDDFS